MKGTNTMNKKILFAMLTVMALLLSAAAFAEETAAVQVGDHFTFGVYEQDNDLTNGKEPLEWRVLKIEGNEALCITEYAIDTISYSTAGGWARWRTATLRDWLSNDFYNNDSTMLEAPLVSVPDGKIFSGCSQLMARIQHICYFSISVKTFSRRRRDHKPSVRICFDDIRYFFKLCSVR